MRIWDCFIFHNELDLLECRVRHLEGVVDGHVLVESSMTHQGDPKPLYFRENAPRFERWNISSVGVSIALTERDRDSCWGRQALQREAIREGLKAVSAQDDDIIIFGDVDEFPRRELISRSMPLPVAFKMQHRVFAVDWLHPEAWLVGTVADKYGEISNFEVLRNSERSEFPYQIPEGGWHFSWLGGPGAIREKARSWAHTELADMMCEWADAGKLYEAGRSTRSADVRDLSVQMIPADTKGLPQWIQDRKCPEEWFRPETTLTWKKGSR